MIDKSKYELPKIGSKKQIAAQIYCTDCKLFTGLYSVNNGNLMAVILKTNCCDKTVR